MLLFTAHCFRHAAFDALLMIAHFRQRGADDDAFASCAQRQRCAPMLMMMMLRYMRHALMRH